MPNRDEEEFELVLGNKQLISLFFLVVMLFAVFFLFGYTMGVRRGEDQVLLAEASTLASPDAAEQQPAAAAPAKPVAPPTQAARPKPVAARPQPKKSAPVESAASKPAPTRTVPPKPVASKPAPPRPAPKRTSTPSGSASDVGSKIHLQIAAFRESTDAGMLVDELKKKGHKAVVFNRGDEWRRVVIGPFPDVAAAKAYQQRLNREGLESLLRNP